MAKLEFTTRLFDDIQEINLIEKAKNMTSIVKILFLPIISFVAFFDIGISFSVATAGTISFVGPCSEDPMLQKDFEVRSGESVGSISISTLDSENIPYLGTEAGFNSIFDTPTGLDAIEVISDTHLRAYGWCFSLNGVSPDEYPDQILLESADDKIVWYFAFAAQINGEWIKQCSPSFRVKPDFLCRETED